MNTKLNVALVLITIILLIGGVTSPLTPTLMPAAAYVEPALLWQSGEALSVIVTAGDSEAAARVVERVGGQVTSDLWLINAVAATISAGQLEALASQPGVQSIAHNKGVSTAEGPGWDGWVTEIRAEKGSHALEATQQTPATYLPDGGFVSVAENGKILIANADGTERARVTLTGGPFKTAAVVAGEDGTIYVAGEAKRVYALTPKGSIRWVFSGAREKFLGGVALGPEGTIYVADENCLPRWRGEARLRRPS